MTVPGYEDGVRIEGAEVWTLEELRNADLTRLRAVREIRSGWWGAPNVRGTYASRTTGRSHVTESRLEEQWLRAYDQALGTTSLHEQPLEFLALPHTPDLLVLGKSRPVLVDVRPASRRGQRFLRQATATAELCQDLGWDYVVHGEMSPVRSDNLEAMWRAAHRRFADDDARALVMERMTNGPARHHYLIRPAGQFSQGRLSTAVFRACWGNLLTFDLDAEPLDEPTLLRLGPASTQATAQEARA